MIKRLLICCRGEIASRIIRTCKLMDIETVVVFPEEDQCSPYVWAADQHIAVRSETIDGSISEIISAAHFFEVDAIAPGYGPFAEKSDFAALCIAEGFIFIGPSPESIKLSGDKSKAREVAEKAGVPVVPGSLMPLNTVECIEIAKEIGFPVIIKAVLGGGGRGIRVVHSLEGFESALHEVRKEAYNAFGCDELYIECFLEENIRHIEVQIISDQHGNAIHLGDRECSIQRRRQKLVEEAPAPNLNEPLRASLYEAALEISNSINYDSAGTVEFLVNGNGEFFFMELNSRIQVEHPVTESISGIDIVEEMILSACGNELRYSQSDVLLSGHAIEFRVCAEDTLRDFSPSTGKVSFYAIPEGEGIRVDSGISKGTVQSPRFDSLCMKLIVSGRSRRQVLDRSRLALRDLKIMGFSTNIPFHLWLLDKKEFVFGKYTLGLFSDFSLKNNQRKTIEIDAIAIASIVVCFEQNNSSLTSKAIKSSQKSSWRIRNGL